MTISSTASRWEYTGDGSTKGFTYSNKVFLSSELQVYLDNVLQTETTHYTVSGAGQSAGGTVTFVTAPTSGADVVIVRSVSNTQSTDYPAGGSLPSGVIEDDIDRRTIISQQIEEKLSRAILTPAGEPQLDMTLPATATRASKYMGFDSNGQPVELDAPTGTTALSTYGAKIGVAADFDDTQALLNLDTSVTTGGSSTVYTLTPAETITSYEDGMVWAVDFHTACGASPTINIDTVGAKSLKWPNGTALAESDVATGQKALLTYDGADVIVLTAGGNAARRDTGVSNGQIPVMDATGYPAADGSQITNLTYANITGTPTSHVEVLDKDPTENDIVNTAAETTLYTYTIPANTLGTDKAVRVTLGGDRLNNSGVARTYTLKIKYGSTTLFEDSTGAFANSASRSAWNLVFTLTAVDSASAQLLNGWLLTSTEGGAVTGTGAIDGHPTAGNGSFQGTSAEDSTGALALTVTITHSAANASLSIRRKVAITELLP